MVVFIIMKYIIIILLFINTYIKANTPDSITVINKTDYDVSELICKALTVLQVKEVIVIVKVGNLKTKSTTNKAMVVENSNNYVYTIYIDYFLTKEDKNNINELILHECIHIKQFYVDDLNQIDNTNMMFRNKLINLNKVPYHQRRYEIEANILIQPILRQFKL